MRKKWPTQANTPIAPNSDHWFNVGATQTNGIVKDIIIAPTTPVNKSVNKGLSDLLNLRVIITIV